MGNASADTVALLFQVRTAARVLSPLYGFAVLPGVVERVIRDVEAAAKAGASPVETALLWLPVAWTALSAMSDALLLAVWFVTSLRPFSQRVQTWARVAYRETWAVVACLRWIRSAGDHLATASSTAEILSTSCFAITMLMGAPLSPRSTGVLSAFVAGQKLLVLLNAV
jgi:hypothetical protein